MKKMLSITVDDEKGDGVTISGALNQDDTFNKIVVLSIGSAKIPVDSQELARALAEVVSFQTPPKKES